MELDIVKKKVIDVGMEEQFPTWLYNDQFKHIFEKDSPENEWFEFTIRRSLQQVVNEDTRAGNEQRPQMTILGDKSKGKKLTGEDKKYYDKVIINAFLGEIHDGPLLAVVKNFDAVYIPNWLHRKILFNLYYEGKWEITTKFHGYVSKIKDDPFNDWDFTGTVEDFKERYGEAVLNERLWNRPVVSKVMCYYSDDHQVNLENKSYHFGFSNQNLTDVQKLHSIESYINRFIKERFGYRLEFIEEQDGVYYANDDKELNYQLIRDNCPLSFLSMSNIKDYDKDFNRVYDTGRHFDHKFFQELKGYELGATLTLLHYNNSVGIQGGIGTNDIEEFLQKDISFEEKWIKEFESKLNRFSKFYDKLWDINQNIVKTKKNIFNKERSNIISAFMLFQDLEMLGEFDMDNFDFDIRDGSFHQELVEIHGRYQQWHPHAPKKSPDDFFGARRTISNVERHKIMRKIQMNALVNKGVEYNYVDGKNKDKTISYTINNDGYLNSNYKFIQPGSTNRTFSSEVQQEVFDENGRVCMITGERLPFTLLDAHHKIWFKNGGTNYKPNCMMIDRKLNRNWFQKSNCKSTSDGIQKLVKQQPELFTDEMLKYWINGGIEEVEEFENNIDNYYWPTSEDIKDLL